MWRLLALGLLSVTPLSSDAHTAANQFARAYNVWADLQRAPSRDVVSAREILAWKEVQERWKTLNRVVKYSE